MIDDTVENRVLEIVAGQLSLADEEVQLESTFGDDLGADDLDFMEIIMALEEEFDIEIDDIEAESIKTVKDAVEFLKNRGS